MTTDDIGIIVLILAISAVFVAARAQKRNGKNAH